MIVPYNREERGEKKKRNHFRRLVRGTSLITKESRWESRWKLKRAKESVELSLKRGKCRYLPGGETIPRTFLFNFHCADTAYCSTFVIALHSIRLLTHRPWLFSPQREVFSLKANFVYDEYRVLPTIEWTFDRKTNENLTLRFFLLAS